MEVLIWLLGAIGSAFIGILLTILFQDQAKVVLATRISRLRKTQKRGIEGVWKATFYVVRGKEAVAYVETIRLRHALGIVVGNITPHKQNYPALRAQETRLPLRLRGEIGETFYLTGLWFHPLDTHRFSGSFQLLIDPDGHEMRGKWVGFSSTLGAIDSGEWVFERMRDAG